MIHSRPPAGLRRRPRWTPPTASPSCLGAITVAEERRAAPRVEFPEQELERRTTAGGRSGSTSGLESEDHNAGMSLATNLAVADALHAAKTGLFR